MTLPPKRSLLHDFVDNELSDEETFDVQRMLEQSKELQEEHQELVRLKQLLKQMPVNDPGEEYWSESTNLILARTIQNESTEEPVVSLPDELARRRNQRNAFFRSALSAAASLVIFFSALVIGSLRSGNEEANFAADGQLLVTTALAEQLNSPIDALTLESEKAHLAVGDIMVGPPGHVGRFLGASELLPTD